MYQSGRAEDKAKKHKSPAKSRRVGITVLARTLSSSVLTAAVGLSVHKAAGPYKLGINKTVIPGNATPSARVWGKHSPKQILKK